MKKLILLFLGMSLVSLRADDVENQTSGNLATAAQVAGAGLSAYSAWQIAKIWNSPESRQLYDTLVKAYTEYLDTYEPGISAFNRSGRIMYFKYAEAMRQIAAPYLLFVIGAEVAALITIAKMAQKAEAAEDADEDACAEEVIYE